jgi:hypothetical protein
MGKRVLKQPDGKYAVWDSIVDDFIVWDATADEIDTYIVTEAIKKAQDEAMHHIAKAEATSPDIFSEKLALRQELHGQVNSNDPDELEYGEWVKKWSEI